VAVLADYLKPLGYACAYTGKWHLGTGGDRRGFDAYVTRTGNFDVDSPAQNDAVVMGRRVGLRVEGGYARNVDSADYDSRTRLGSSLQPLAFHPAMMDATHAATFIRRQSGQGRPFAVAFSCHEPHPPFVAPHPFGAMYDAGDFPLPVTLDDPNGPRLMARRGDTHLKPAARFTAAELRRMWAAYLGAVSYVDHLLGTILAALIETDQLDDTLLIYTSDHGEMLGSHGLWSKGAVFYEELVNVPLLVKPPGGASGAHETRHLVSHLDLLPTVLRWCGAEVPDALQGVDIRPLVEGKDQPLRDGVPFEFHSVTWGGHLTPLRGWRTEAWKYVEGRAGAEELYDLRADPDEMRNLIEDPSAAAARETMREDLHRWLLQTGDRWPEVALPPQRSPVDQASATRT
jgi:choline-sulfatase